MGKRIAVIGNGAMTFACIKLLNENSKCELLLIISNPKYIDANLDKRLGKYCLNNSIDYISASNFNTENISKVICNLDLDYIFNIDSFTILKPFIFKLAKNSVVNFHNSPLPRYRGANVTSWAIINDEKQFGVTWHIIDENIDTGEILWQKLFDIHDNETARSLIFRCIEEGIHLFKNNISDLLDDKVRATKQTGNGRTYSRRNIPNNGYINPQWSARKIECFVRGLDFRPFENNFTDAKLKLDDYELIVHKVRTLKIYSKPSTYNPGTILRISDRGIEFSCGDGIILVESISDLDGKELHFNALDFSNSNNDQSETKSVA